MTDEKKSSILRTGLSAILYLVNPHSAEPKGPWGGALGSTCPLAVGWVPSSGRSLC